MESCTLKFFKQEPESYGIEHAHVFKNLKVLTLSLQEWSKSPFDITKFDKLEIFVLELDFKWDDYYGYRPYPKLIYNSAPFHQLVIKEPLLSIQMHNCVSLKNVFESYTLEGIPMVYIFCRYLSLHGLKNATLEFNEDCDVVKYPEKLRYGDKILEIK